MNTATRITAARPVSANSAALPLARKVKALLASILRQTVQLLVVAVLATLTYLVISRFLLQSVTVVGRSMVPTLYDSQHYLLNRWVYCVEAPHRADVVVLRDPSDNGFSVKRIIGTPGDSVYLKDGDVYVNGRKLSEPYLSRGMRTFTDSTHRDQLMVCGKDQYFLLGDNRLNSIDSRMYGPVPRRNILGPIIH